MEILIKEKSDPGRQYIFINVKEIFISKLYDTEGNCIQHYYKLVDMSGELHDECWDIDRYVIYKKVEFNEEVILDKCEHDWEYIGLDEYRCTKCNARRYT